MNETKLEALARLGQSVWLDYIRRSLLEEGGLQDLINEGLRGVTSNPTIFEKSIAGSADYDEEIAGLSRMGRSPTEIYEALALGDVGWAADLLLPVYQRTDGLDGYVSLEVEPSLAHDTAGTIRDALRLFSALARPNVMIKVPATPEGIPAIERLIGEGLNINVTLIFSVAQYEPVAAAYLAGLERRVAAGLDVHRIASVASFFVSRVDTSVDALLEQKHPGRKELLGMSAVANARAAYATFRRLLEGRRWRALQERGARPQRVLWASTGTKNPAYSDTLYVDELMGEHTVNTMPPATLDAFRDHGKVASTIGQGLAQAEAHFRAIHDLGIDMEAVTARLQQEGVTSFARSFETLMAAIAEKRDRLRAGKTTMAVTLGRYTPDAQAAIGRLVEGKVMRRIWNHDHTVWRPEPTEITDRLGWLDSAERMAGEVERLQRFADEVRDEGITHALLCGMGGSSLAPEVYRKVYGVRPGYLDLAVLDSTDPDAVLAEAERLDPKKTLFVISTKSGGTVETSSFFKFFWGKTVAALGERAGSRFCAITDPGSSLAALAERHHFRRIFLADPHVGGRYSALTHFGLVPAALIGADLTTLLDRARTMVCNCEPFNCPEHGDNAGGRLGAWIGTLANAGRDKLTLIPSDRVAPFGAWLEQLLAESTGKDGKGILPVEGEPVGAPDAYGPDRVFVQLDLEGDDQYDRAVDALAAAGHPVLRLYLRDTYDLGAQIFLWEMATAVAGHVIGVQPFDQPNVESAKVLARRMVDAYRQEGRLPAATPALRDDGIAVYGETSARDAAGALREFIDQARPGDYVALHAYVEPTRKTDEVLRRLRVAIRARRRVATTVGYGPRFLHSTGQLHKGDAGRGLFLQITADDARDAPIPDEAGASASSLSFGALKSAQALGDAEALRQGGRRVLRVHLGADLHGLERLSDSLA